MEIALNADGYILITVSILCKMKSCKQNQTDDVNPKLIAALVVFIDATPPLRLSKHLHRILLDYIAREKDCLPIDFDVYLSDFSSLFEFLDALIDVQPSISIP